MSRYGNPSNRLPEYDYSQPGAYFITLCAHDRVHLFGEIIDEGSKQGKTVLNPYGEIVRFTWFDLVRHNAGIELDEFIIMPNHFHGIIFISDSNFVAAGSKPAGGESVSSSASRSKRHGLPEIVRQLKSFSARRINAMRKTPGVPVWQRNYYDHVIRNEKDFDRVRQYIMDNPYRWLEDELYRSR